MSRIDRVIRDTIVTGNDASRVSDRKRGRPSFQLLLNARDPTPGHSYLRLRRKRREPSAPRVRLRTLNRTSYESKKRDDERAHRREGGERVKEFQHLGTSDRVVGRPRTGCVARIFYCEHPHLQLVNAIIANICSIFIRLIHRAMESGCVIPKERGRLQCGVCPEKRMAKQERRWTRKVSASLMAITSHLPK